MGATTMTESELRDTLRTTLTPGLLRETLEAAERDMARQGNPDDCGPETDLAWAAASLADYLAQELAEPAE